MISSPPPEYISAKDAGVSTTSIWSYGTINLETRYVKPSGKTVQGLIPAVIERKGSIKSGNSVYPFNNKTKHYVVIPRASPDGLSTTIASATTAYTTSGQHLGVFKDIKSAQKYMAALDKRYKKYALSKLKFQQNVNKELYNSAFIDDDSLYWYEGNIDLTNRPIYKNIDGSISTVDSVTLLFDINVSEQIYQYVILPRIVIRNGVETRLTNTDDVRNEYINTGQHLGKYTFSVLGSEGDTLALERAETIAERIHIQQQNLYRPFFSTEVRRAAKEQIWRPVTDMIRVEGALPPFAGIISLSELTDPIAQRIFQERITSVSVEYTMDLASQVVVTVVDTDYSMMNSNYFVPRRLVKYRGREYEIADVRCGQGDGGSPQITLTLCERAIQQMKRDKRRGSVGGNSGYEYARNVANRYNLNFIGQKTAKTRSQFNAQSGNQQESVWDVLDRTAGNNQFVCFLIDGTLIYAQHQYLMWKLGLNTALIKTSKGSQPKKYTPLLYLPGNDSYISNLELERAGIINQSIKTITGGSGFAYRLETLPSFETSDNDALAAEGSCRVLMPNGGQLRPGNTVVVGPQPDYFFGGYLVTSVKFNEGSPESADVTFRTPEEPKKQNGLPLVNRMANRPSRRVGD